MSCLREDARIEEGLKVGWVEQLMFQDTKWVIFRLDLRHAFLRRERIMMNPALFPEGLRLLLQQLTMHDEDCV